MIKSLSISLLSFVLLIFAASCKHDDGGALSGNNKAKTPIELGGILILSGEGSSW